MLPQHQDNILVSGATTGTTAKYVSITQLATTVNGLLSGVTFEADSGTPIVVEDGDTIDFAGGTYITTLVNAGAIGIGHDTTSRTDTTSTDAPSAGGTFTAVDSVTSNSTGHVNRYQRKDSYVACCGYHEQLRCKW